MRIGPILIENARLLDPASGLDAAGYLVIEGERIAGFGPGALPPPTEAQRIDAGGLCLAPGLVDMRVALGEPGFEHKETLATASRAAAAGGVTAMVALPTTDPVIDDVAGLEYIARRAREAKLIKIFAYAAATRELEGLELTEMGLLAEAGALGFTDGSRPIHDAVTLRRALSYASSFGLLLLQHPEEPRLAEGGQMNEGAVATRLGLAGIPREAEIIQIERDLRLVALTSGRLHFSHISTEESVALIAEAKRQGLDVSCDTAPPYFMLTELDVGDYRTFAKLSPPLRSEADRQGILAGLADGIIDCITSDHQPQDQESKRVPFAQAEPGAVGLETLLPLTLELVQQGHCSMLEALAKVTCQPADLLGLPLGRLRIGGPADLVLFDPERPWQCDRDSLHSKSKNTPFDRMGMTGRAIMTFVDGRIAFDRRADA